MRRANAILGALLAEACADADEKGVSLDKQCLDYLEELWEPVVDAAHALPQGAAQD